VEDGGCWLPVGGSGYWWLEVAIGLKPSWDGLDPKFGLELG
jgi:hypothetical protein